MARQLAALPKQKFEVYRSKKMLSNDHSFLWPGSTGSGQVMKDKLNTNFISKSFINNLEKDLNVLQNQVEVLGAADLDQGSSDAKLKSGSKRKRVKSKKGKSANSVASNVTQSDVDSKGKPNTNASENGTGEQQTDSAANDTATPHSSDVNMKHKTLLLENCVPLCVSMNTNLVADISIRRELESGKSSMCSKTDLMYCGSSSSNDSGIVTPKELFLSDDIKEVDSGLGSYTSPVFVREPPFGFPPSSQKLLESALGLLPSAALEHDHSSESAKPSEKTRDLFQQSEDFHGGHVIADNKNVKKPMQKQNIEEDPISDVSDSKDICKDFVVVEGDSVDGDVSSSSAVEDEGGWQSQSRSHRRKKKELAARANREKHQMDKFHGKDFRKQLPDSHFKKNCHRRKSVDSRKNHSKTTEKVFQNTENRNNKTVDEFSTMPTNVDGQIQAKNCKGNELKAVKGPDATSDKKLNSQKVMSPMQKVLSYRDALLKVKDKVEPTESSDSGVDANSFSSCEMSSPQLEMQNDSFNKQQCVYYLRNAWKKVMSEAKQGLVVYFSVDSDPVLCEKRRKNRTSDKHGASSKLQ